MGHDTGIAGAYNVGKPWSDDLLERARDEYLSAIPYLETNATPEGDVKRELVQSLIRSIEEAAKRKSGADAGMTAEELVAALTQTLTRNVGEPNGKSIALVPVGEPNPPGHAAGRAAGRRDGHYASLPRRQVGRSGARSTVPRLLLSGRRPRPQLGS